jgi:hypothetical protein
MLDDKIALVFYGGVYKIGGNKTPLEDRKVYTF